MACQRSTRKPPTAASLHRDGFHRPSTCGPRSSFPTCGSGVSARRAGANGRWRGNTASPGRLWHACSRRMSARSGNCPPGSRPGSARPPGPRDETQPPGEAAHASAEAAEGSARTPRPPGSTPPNLDASRQAREAAPAMTSPRPRTDLDLPPIRLTTPRARALWLAGLRATLPTPTAHAPNDPSDRHEAGHVGTGRDTDAPTPWPGIGAGNGWSCVGWKD